jgi:ArsR family transcriptional regulator
MRKEYDLATLKGRKNPYAARLKQQVTIRLGTDVIAYFKALADERRLRIVELLLERERCVCELAESLGISEALVSHHVKRLRAAGLVNARRGAQWLYCSLDEDAFSALSTQLAAVSRAAATAGEATVGACADPTPEEART